MYDITFIYCHYNSFILACPGKPELYFAIYPPITGSGFQKESRFRQMASTPVECGNSQPLGLSVPHMATLFPGYLTKHLEIMDMKKLSFQK